MAASSGSGPPSPRLARKQTTRDQDIWSRARQNAAALWPDDRLDELIDTTVTRIKDTVGSRRAALAWSGGKDSLALQLLAAQAGITEAVLAITEELEYPAFLRWVTDHMPDDLTVVSTGQTLAWLADHPEMLFPQGNYGSRWFQIVNHRGQERYYRDRGLEMLLLGRRRSDGNYTGPKGADLYTNKRGVTRYSPLASWDHEAVFALLDRHQIELPPCYAWPRGYQVGTGAWPARQWTRDTDHGFEEVWQIDPDVIRTAAGQLPAAADWMARTGRS
ncbi:phosphoadenosine phosphosulfate reductase family protein [Actinomadura miaoliensis]|uniref:Phosphoadenosine phosphosulphate reductase domain-containing protein n=1 Tax=Actinomadura miaoliensis TaxID=430685 RepID=A0ABP7WBC9_9ACTN